MNNMAVRALSGIVYVALIVAAILCGKFTFFLLTLLFGILGLLEFQNMIAERNDGNALSPFAKGLDLIVVISLLCCSVSLSYSFTWIFSIVLIPLIIAALGLRLFVAVFDKDSHAVSNVAQSVLGMLYIGLPLCLLNLIESVRTPFTTQFILLTFVLIWLNDTGAYIFGSKFGKRRLCERLSPKKSWEGFWGGFGCCIAACIVFGICYHNNVAIMAVYGAVVSIFATVGDLFESMLKRSAGVKDSGNLIPGHGGILDRIDSLLFVAYPAVFFALLVLASVPINNL